MKLLSYALDRSLEPRLGMVLDGRIVDVMRASLWMKQENDAVEFLQLPSTMDLLLSDWTRSYPLLQKLREGLASVDLNTTFVNERPIVHSESEIVFFPPVPQPPSIRFFETFETQVYYKWSLVRKEPPPHWNALPHFHYGNPTALLGHRWEIAYNPEIGKLAFGLGIAAILAANGKQAAGYTIAGRIFSIDRLKLELEQGTSPGYSDLGTALGPYLVTADELSNLAIGKGFNVEIVGQANETEIARANWSDILFSFPEMIQHASLAAELHAAENLIAILDTVALENLSDAAGVRVECQGIGALEILPQSG